jgi:hypothetical protein
MLTYVVTEILFPVLSEAATGANAGHISGPPQSRYATERQELTEHDRLLAFHEHNAIARCVQKVRR